MSIPYTPAYSKPLSVVVNTTNFGTYQQIVIIVKVISVVYSVCVCVFSSHSFWTSSSLDVPAGVTLEEGHTRFLISLLSAVRAIIFLARRIQPLLSLADREAPVGHIFFCFLVFLFSFFSEKNPVCRDRTHVPTCRRVRRYLLSTGANLALIKRHCDIIL